jgi:hypothetical protein
MIADDDATSLGKMSVLGRVCVFPCAILLLAAGRVCAPPVNAALSRVMTASVRSRPPGRVGSSPNMSST